MKKIMCLILFFTIVLSVISFGADAQTNDIRINFNGKEINMTEKPFIEGGRTLVPIRFIAENMGLKVDWNENSKQVLVTSSNTKITLTINENKAYVNEKEIILDTKAIISDSRTYVPVRFIAESMGLKVDWNETSRTIKLRTADYKEQNLGYKNAEDFGNRPITDFISEGIPQVNINHNLVYLDKVYISSYSDLPLKIGDLTLKKIEKIKGNGEYYLKVTTSNDPYGALTLTYIKLGNKKGIEVTKMANTDINKDGTKSYYFQCVNFWHKKDGKGVPSADNSDYIVISNLLGGTSVLIDNPFKK